MLVEAACEDELFHCGFTPLCVCFRPVGQNGGFEFLIVVFSPGRYEPFRLLLLFDSITFQLLLLSRLSNCSKLLLAGCFWSLDVV
jgi:hypothetical protein